MATKMVLIEYTEKVTSSPRHAGGDDETTIEPGTQRRVDAASAKSLVEVRKVAKLVEPGTQRRVDAASAKSLVESLVEVRKVAKLVGDKDEKDAAREAVKAVDAPAETPRSANATGGS